MTLAGDTLSEKSTPVPLRAVCCGLPLTALSLMVSVPERAPLAVGVKVTLTLQCCPADSAPLQLFVCAKSPLATMLVMFIVASPLLVSVSCCEELVVETV